MCPFCGESPRSPPSRFVNPMFIADAHLDLAYNQARGRDITLPARRQPLAGEREPETATVGLPDLQRAGVGLVCATIFCQPQTDRHPGYTDHAGALAQARAQLQIYQELWKTHHLQPVLAQTDLPGSAPADEPAPGAIPMILLVEGADAISLAGESDDATAAAWRAAGARMVGLAWGRTRYAGGTGAPGPLTSDGRRLVSELDDAGFIHDASHLSEASLDYLLTISRRPICASHSNCRAILRDDPRGRHLDDRHIRAIAQRDGVIGVVLYDRFLLPPDDLAHRRASWGDVVRHIDHICQLTGGCGHAGIGSDLDGGFGREHVPEELETIADLPELSDALAARGYADADIARIMGGNWLEFFRRCLV